MTGIVISAAVFPSVVSSGFSVSSSAYVHAMLTDKLKTPLASVKAVKLPLD